MQWLIFHMSILETKGLTPHEQIRCKNPLLFPENQIHYKLHTSEHRNFIWLSNKVNSIHHIHIHLSLNQEPIHAIQKKPNPHLDDQLH